MIGIVKANRFSNSIFENEIILRPQIVALSLVLTLFSLWAAIPAKAGVSDDLAALLKQDAVTVFGVAYSTSPLASAYKDLSHQPVWTNENGPNELAKALIREIGGSDTDGLIPFDYLASLADGWQNENPAKLEILFSTMFRKYGRDLNGGRTTAAISEPDIVIKRKKFDMTHWLQEINVKGPAAVTKQLRPVHPQYERLRTMLKAYRQLATRGGWPAISKGKTLKPDMVDPRVVELRNNMAGKGYNGLLNVAEPERYDERVAGAVSHFQARNGLEDDAVVGPKSLAALNVPAEKRVEQIIVNMERWRWLQRELGTRHVLVNQASFTMQVVNKGDVIDERRVIVGKEYHKSPMFSDRIRYLEFNPTWTVPRSIAGSEILPKLRKDPSYLSRNNYKLYTSWKANAPAVNAHSVDWDSVSSKNFRYKIVQQPGERNALGRVKFMFPNSFNVYLHDTPSRGLFSRAERALSHGCIRVFDPLGFAELLLKTDTGLSRSKINNIVKSKKLTRISLKKPVPVHLSYFTVWVKNNGVPAFYNDVYKRDALVGRVFFGAV